MYTQEFDLAAIIRRGAARAGLLKLRESLPLVQEILGHADPDTTRRIYGHLELDDERRALSQLRFRTRAGG